MDVDVTALSTAQFEKSAAHKHDYDSRFTNRMPNTDDAARQARAAAGGESG